MKVLCVQDINNLFVLCGLQPRNKQWFAKHGMPMKGVSYTLIGLSPTGSGFYDILELPFDEFGNKQYLEPSLFAPIYNNGAGRPINDEYKPSTSLPPVIVGIPGT